MKYSDNIKRTILRRLKHEFESKVYFNSLSDLIEFMGKQYDLNKTFPYNVFYNDSLTGYLNNTKSGLFFNNWLETLTCNIETPFNKSRKLIREIKKLSEGFSDVTPFRYLNYERLVISFCSFFVYSNKDKYFNDNKDYMNLENTLNLLVDYLLCFLYIVNSKEQEEIEYILNEVIHSNTTDLIWRISNEVKKVKIGVEG